MKILEKNGDMFNSEAQVLVHQVNCMGVMGSGVARQIRNKYPSVFLAYHNAVKTLSGNCLGGCIMVESKEEPGRWIANLFGQYYYRGFKDDDLYIYDEFWKQPELNESGSPVRFTNYEALYNSLCRLRNECQRNNLLSLAFPYKIGCDRGGASWEIVKTMIQEVFKGTNIEIEIWKL